jgi:hypothetical protein
MPLSPILEVILQPVAEMALQLAGYITACVVVPVFTLGVVGVEPGPDGEFVKPKLGAIQRLANGKLVVEAELASLVGLLFWVAVGVGVYFARRS